MKLKNKIAALVAAVSIGGLTGLADVGIADAAISGCSSWRLYEATTAREGRAGQCTTYSGSGYNRWRLAITCTNQGTIYTYWSPAGLDSYGKFCNYPHVVSGWSFQFGSAG